MTETQLFDLPHAADESGLPAININDSSPLDLFYKVFPIKRIEDEPVLTSFVRKRFSYMTGSPEGKEREGKKR